METNQVFKGGLLWIAMSLGSLGVGFVNAEKFLWGIILVGVSLVTFVLREVLKKYFNSDL